jgi:hypothetical protein
MQETSLWSQIEQSIRFHLYASTLLQPWYFFLFFETRSLPGTQQDDSKQIELDGIDCFEAQIQSGIDDGEFQSVDARMVANTIVVLLEDWYLKPWKNRAMEYSGSDPDKLEEQIDQYHRSIVELVKKLLVKS